MNLDKHPYIINSHQQCEVEYNMNPYDLVIPKFCISKNLIEKKKEALSDLMSIAQKFMKKLISDIEDMPALIVTTDHEGYILELYGDELIKGQIELLGLSMGIQFKEEESGTNAISLALKYEEPIRMIGDDHFHQILHESACFSVPFYHLGKLGGTISVMMAAKDASSFHLGLLQSAVDSIEREVKIKSQNKKLLLLNQVLIENSRHGIIITDEEGKVVELNPYAESVLTYKREKILNTSVNNLPLIGEYMVNVLEDQHTYEDIEVQIGHKILLYDSFPVFNESNQIIGAFGQFRDVTERLMLEKQLMASEKLSAIGKISAGLAHEIRNPLTSIIGLMQLFKSQLINPNSKQENYFKIIFSELERIKNLVSQFVQLAKPKQKGLSKSLFSLNELVLDIRTLMESQLVNKQVQLVIDAPVNVEVHMDRDMITQVLINILQNSLEAIEKEGEICISVFAIPEDHRVGIKISDDGIGMDAASLDQVFTPFYSTKENGLGLGLPMSHNLIELHKGKIEVNSELGKGTTFTIWLPIL